MRFAAALCPSAEARGRLPRSPFLDELPAPGEQAGIRGPRQFPFGGSLYARSFGKRISRIIEQVACVFPGRATGDAGDVSIERVLNVYQRAAN